MMKTARDLECSKPPQLYVGWDDMNGPVTGLNGPSAVIPVPPGSIKLRTGLGLRFSGGVDFEHFELHKSGALGGTLNIDMGAVGGWAKGVAGSENVATEAIAAGGVVVDATREQVAVIRDFATESAELPPGGDVVIEQLVQELEDFKRSHVDPGNQDLEKHGIDPEQNFTIDLDVEGWASLRWSAALTDAERRQRNLELSRRRAEVVAGLTASRLAHHPVRIDVIPRGSGIIGPLAPGDEKKPTSEDEVLAEIDDLERHVAELEKRIAAEKTIGHDVTAMIAERDELRARIKEKKALIDPKKPDADDSELHQARIHLRWRGKRIDNGMPTPPTKLKHH